MYVGRPWGMEVRNITVSRPTHQLDQGKMWKPYPSAVGYSTVPGDGITFPLESCTDANISLCEIMQRINATLYVFSAPSRLDACPRLLSNARLGIQVVGLMSRHSSIFLPRLDKSYGRGWAIYRQPCELVNPTRTS